MSWLKIPLASSLFRGRAAREAEAVNTAAAAAAMPSAAEPVVLIVGAGLTGLLAAQGLKQNGFRAIVVEKEEGIDARPREWTMLVHWAMPILRRLVPEEVLRDLDGALCNSHLEFDAEVETLPCYNGVTGDLLFSSPTPGARRVSRRRLRALLARGIDVRWGMCLKNIAQTDKGVKAEFEDGTAVDADYLLGTDGTSSKVREVLLGADKARAQGSGFLFATGINRYDEAYKTDAIVRKHPVAALMMGTGSVGGIGVVSAEDASDKSTWTTFWVKIWRGEAVELGGQEALDYISKHTAPLRDEFQMAIDWTEDDAYVGVNEMKYWVPVGWDNHDGRVTLAGDAAHPMLIYRGQGFQHSITDVENYINALVQLHVAPGDGGKGKGKVTGEAGRAEVMGAYDDEVVKRGAEAVQQSLCEAEKSLDIGTVKQMLMATKGHGR
ncbi:Monooxygenase, FAD-binding protein [Cordyceps fumosorosea ARSEF 2679]|uniref:Monooxygenase, FAD-binding protein n=1 Tax=Cordyceps fumosorosea (strain ARSEF 2679) TaxID=1081104 RepID=A0A167M385_CORFA|nr:Monooxygenase, FAD-binding protein [Cordyceps fumosorosea ARSEF 2679]OAA53862.1 Monooxygenase, FAD-binding protein [Cordyceps fumosorosea ARSEF 2679]